MEMLKQAATDVLEDGKKRRQFLRNEKEREAKVAITGNGKVHGLNNRHMRRRQAAVARKKEHA